MIIIKCARCKSKIFKYEKIGKGRILNCWHNRIVEDISIHKEDAILCQCGNLIGIDIGKGVKMKQNSFIYTGTITKK
jgi:DNA-directed RNA polymerase subunit RPC12/RpoP